MLRGAERDRLVHLQRRLDVGEHHRGRAVRHERAVGALQRSRDERVLLALAAAELEAEILAQLRIRIADAVLVVLRRDHRERVGLVAVFLEIGIRDLAEDAREAALDVRLVLHVGGLEQVAADLRPRRRGHLFDADHEHDARGLRLERAQALMDRRRTGRAGILDPRRALEAQIGRGLQNQRGGKILLREACVEVPEDDLVHIGGRDAGIRNRIRSNPYDQALDRLGIEPPERRMRPSHDAAGHDGLLAEISSPSLTKWQLVGHM